MCGGAEWDIPATHAASCTVAKALWLFWLRRALAEGALGALSLECGRVCLEGIEGIDRARGHTDAQASYVPQPCHPYLAYTCPSYVSDIMSPLPTYATITLGGSQQSAVGQTLGPQVCSRWCCSRSPLLGVTPWLGGQFGLAKQLLAGREAGSLLQLHRSTQQSKLFCQWPLCTMTAYSAACCLPTRRVCKSHSLWRE